LTPEIGQDSKIDEIHTRIAIEITCHEVVFAKDISRAGRFVIVDIVRCANDCLAT